MDILHDNSRRTWFQIGTAHEELIPDYVLDSPAPEKTADAHMDVNYYADPARQWFPLDSKEATWLSAAYFAKNAAGLDYDKDTHAWVRQQIKDAADVWAIAEDVEKIMTAIEAAPEEKTASDDDDNYGWVMRDGETGDVLARKYPMFDARGVKKASDYFAEYRARYPAGIRRKIARAIMRKAGQHDINNSELAPAVLKEAGYGLPRKDVLMSEILERAYLAKDAEVAIALANVNELVYGVSDEELSQNLDKFAEVLDEFDRSAGLTQYYGTRILMPADFLFDVSMKQAEAALADAIELNQYVFSIDKLASLQPSIYGDILGDNFIGFITDDSGKLDRTKLAEAITALPVPDKAALEEHLERSFG